MKIKRLTPFIKPYVIHIIFSIVFALVSVALSLYIPILTGEAIDVIIGSGQVDMEKIINIIIWIAILIPICAVATYVMNLLNNHICYGVSKDMREAAFSHLMKLDIEFFDSHKSGDITSRISADADAVADGLLMGISNLFTGIITILGTICFMFSVSALIAAVVVVVTPVSLLVARFIARRSFDKFSAQARDRGEQMSIAEEAIENMNVIRSYGAEDIFIEKYSDATERLKKNSFAATFFSSITNPSTRFVNSIVYASVGVFGAMYAMNGGISVGMLSVFLSYASQYTKPFNEISGVITELQNSIACAGRIYEILDEKTEEKGGVKTASKVGDTENKYKQIKNENMVGSDTKNAYGRVVFDKVSFSYDKDKKLIENLNLNVNSGDRVAIVGPTGAGKSTLINLIMRFYDVDDGNILVSGKDVRKYDRDELRAGFGMVLQETFIRAGTIRDNITFGREGFSDEEIIEAAKNAHAHSFIKKLPKGYDTVLTENGGGLSEGEKQLLCIARVMLDVPGMLILDEATSSIDTRTELLISQSFKQMMSGRTSFIVAHRLQTIRDADTILVMTDGKVVEQGSHDALLTHGGYYSKLFYLSQS
ncbi:MAG: ABC transporter ATP-binding protein/permease [Eubacterium sp.]|nr:ABC transporter ATP-binding protein/permease [Eubacterium sp.]